jgi:ABC-2 type transport system ATP-binding protein
MIDCQGLTKQYGHLRAVDDLTFRVQPGEVLGFLGPNGAGKTTTMRIVAGFLPATDGRVTVCGFDVDAQATEAKRRIGYLPEGAPCYPEMTPRTFLEFIAAAREVAPQKRKGGSTKCSSSCTSRRCSIRRSIRCRRATSAASASHKRSFTTPRC